MGRLSMVRPRSPEVDEMFAIDDHSDAVARMHEL